MAASSRETFDPESLLSSLMTNVPGAVYRCRVDADWTMLGIGDDIERITGYPASDFIASARRSFSSIIHPEDHDRVHAECRRQIDAGESFALEYRVASVRGGWRWVLDRGIRTLDREGNEWLDGVIFDITERRAAEEALRARDAEAARVAELQASRIRIIAAADDARRRLARDLHDGAQQRLLSGALRLSLLERRLRDDDLLELVREARAELEAGLAAVRELADRCLLPVELRDELAQRADPAVEAALYYTVAEALTNVVRYAKASSATVSLYRANGCAVAEITDDGCGGADQGRGSGLRGLSDRLGALQGTLELESPPGRGTSLRARVPLATWAGEASD